MITKRDRDIYNFVDTFNAATTSQICRMFYADSDLRICRRRLKTLTDRNYLNRKKDFVTGEYIYYTRAQKPEQIEHNYFRTELFIRLQERYTIQRHDVECIDYSGLRPDMYMEIRLQNMLYLFFVEIHLHNRFNQEKYEQYYRSGAWKEKIRIFPRILIVAHEKPKLQPSSLNYRIVPTSMVGLKTIFE